MTLGLFLQEGLGFSHPMQIGSPLLSSAPVFTSWYVVGILSVCVQTAIILIYEFARKIKSKKCESITQVVAEDEK